MTYFLCHNALPLPRIRMACKRENVQRDKTPTRFDWSNSQISHCYRKVVATLWRTFRITMRSIMIINSRIFYNWFVWLLLALLFNWILLLAFYWKRVLRTMDWGMLLLAIMSARFEERGLTTLTMFIIIIEPDLEKTRQQHAVQTTRPSTQLMCLFPMSKNCLNCNLPAKRDFTFLAFELFISA